jgi:hypothetical protein
MGIADGFTYPRWEKEIGSIETTARETVHVLPSKLEIEAVVLKARIDAKIALSSLAM